MHIVGKIGMSVVQRGEWVGITDNAASKSLELSMAPFQVTSRCTLDVDAGEDGSSPIAAGILPVRSATWKVGYMQLQTMEVNWAYYRGESDGDGCVFVDKVVNRRVGACRDVKSEGALWYEISGNRDDCYAVPQGINAAKRAPWNDVWFVVGDSPTTDWAFEVPNNLRNGTPNYLYEFRAAQQFLTLVVQQDRSGRLSFLRHFTWKVVWHGRSERATGVAKSAMDFKLVKDSGFTRGAFIDGAPGDGSYIRILNDEGVGPSANRIANSTLIQKDYYPRWTRIEQMMKADKPF
jgi:hypothetical protein